MSSTASPIVTESTSRPFLWARLASLLSVLPLGAWTVFHLWSNLAAFQGAQAWEKSATTYAHPAAQFTTAVVVLLPLLLHTVWGIQRLFTSRPNNTRYSNWDNAKYLLHRVAAVGVLFFLGAHIYLAMLHPRLGEGHAETFNDIAAHMSHHPPTLIVYLLGTLGVAYHLGNGLVSFAWTWGLISGRRSLRNAGILSAVVVILLTAMAWGTIYALYQAGAPLPTPES